jgi:hypothetical protein
VWSNKQVVRVPVDVANFGDHLDIDINMLCRIANRRQRLFEFVPRRLTYTKFAPPAAPPHYRFSDVWRIVSDLSLTDAAAVIPWTDDRITVLVTDLRLAEEARFRGDLQFPEHSNVLSLDCYGVWLQGDNTPMPQRNTYILSTYLFKKLLAQESYRTVYQYAVTDITSFLCQRLCVSELYHYDTRWDIFDYSDDTEEFVKGLKLSFIGEHAKRIMRASEMASPFDRLVTGERLLEAAERLLRFSRRPRLLQVLSFIYRSTFFSTVFVVGLFSVFNGLLVALITEADKILILQWMAAALAPIVILVLWMRLLPFGELRS